MQNISSAMADVGRYWELLDSVRVSSSSSCKKVENGDYVYIFDSSFACFVIITKR